MLTVRNIAIAVLGTLVVAGLVFAGIWAWNSFFPGEDAKAQVEATATPVEEEVAKATLVPSVDGSAAVERTDLSERSAVSALSAQADAAQPSASGFWIGFDDIYVAKPANLTPPGPYWPLEPQEISGCVGELVSNCVRAPREKDAEQKILLYYGRNSTNCWQDGHVFDPVAGKMLTYAPPGFVGFTEGLTLRRCELYGPNLDPWRLTPQGPPSRQLQGSTTSSVSYVVPTVTPQAVSTGNVVASTNLNVRSGPGTEYPIVGSLAPGQAVPELFREGSWIVIQMPNGVSGWVAGWLTNQNLPAPSVGAAVPTPVPSGIGGGGSASGPSSVTTEVAVNWQLCEDGQAWCWNTYKDADDNPVVMTLKCGLNGEYIREDGKADSPIPAGTWKVTGITALPCPS